MAGKAIVYWRDKKAGALSEQDDGYGFLPRDKAETYQRLLAERAERLDL